MIPFRTPFFIPYLYPSLAWRIPVTNNKLFITFDDGPVSGPTEFVLETLSRFSSKATFFCIGDNVRKYPLVFKKIIEEGHAIGNHTYNHLNGWRTEIETYLENVKLCDAQLNKSLNLMRPNRKPLFRPPYGKITRRQIKSLSRYKIIMWDVLTKDYSEHISAEVCLRESIKATRNGSIIIFHDSYKAESKLKFVLPRYLDHFRQQGFEFESL
jgi:peptidoglycan/xylan/chitin deacetylase (PgdA/CDA1 family)